MARKQSVEKRAAAWQDRITSANKAYDRWDQEFHCDRLEKYYKGMQWAGLTEEEAQKKYVINLIFPTIETSTPALMFYRPQVKVEPRPTHADDANSNAAGRAELLEDTLQTFVDDPKVNFKAQTLLALKDAWFRFGVVEVGYTSDWIDNPHAGKPLLKEDDSPQADAAGKPIIQPDRIPKSEQLFLKRIPAHTFRSSVSSCNQLEDNDWVGYYQWVYAEDLKRNPKYSNTDKLQAGGQVRDVPGDASDPEREQHIGMVKIWKIWDLRAQVRHVVADGAKDFLLEGEACPYVPLAVLKFYELLDSFYPLPAVANWIGPQDELNETREGQRTHRRRFYRRYTYMTGSIDDPELEKLESGGDGAYAKRNVPNAADALVPVQDAPLDANNTILEVKQTREDFASIAGVTGESMQTPQADTATQANIQNTRQMLRESQSRILVADWLAQICRLMALTLRHKMQLPFWVQANADPFAQDPKAQAVTSKNWQQLTSEQLGEFDFDVKIDIASLSPVSEESQRMNWNQVLALLMNPQALMLMQPNPETPTEPSPLLRKTLGYYGIKSDQEVREIARVAQQALEQMMLAQMAAMAGKQGGGAGAGMGAPTMPGGPTQAPTGIPSPGVTVQ